MKNLDRILEELREPMLETLKSWLQIPSVKEEPAPGAPFGQPIRKMLDQALSDCERLGFQTLNVDGYAGHADMGEGETEDALAILAHLDVVPVGDGWTRAPFGAKIEDGKIYARGASDDKGPAVAALYAMHAVQLAGIPLKRKVRLILGCDEESDWDDIAYYEKKVPIPRTGFSPDADYPVINIEKGMLGLALHARPSKDGLQVVHWSTGERTNVVPGIASALVRGGEDLIEKTQQIGEKFGWPVRAEKDEELMRITAEGIPGHAAYPQVARNAIGQLLLTLRELGTLGPLRTMADVIGLSCHGEKMGAYIEDGISGKLTCNLGIIRVDMKKIYATLDIRCPVLTDREMLFQMISQNLPDFKIEKTVEKPPHYVPENSELVQALLNAYHEVSGLEKKTLAIGGGTYAKVLKEGVAFGASFPGEPDVAHQADEYVCLQSLYDSMKIFAHAIIGLAGK